jgi:16S rRNA (uracil1498-N3)-methyltransferase
MRDIRLFTPQTLTLGETTELDSNASKHASQVLRLKPGHTLTLFNGNGKNYQAQLLESGKKARVSILKEELNNAESNLHLKLTQGISRGDKMDFTLQKAVELGVTEIQAVFTQHSTVSLSGSRLTKKVAHWQGVIQSACEQSGRSLIPELHPPLQLSQYLATPCKAQRLMLDPQAQTSFKQLSLSQADCELLIGPEGGFNQAELQMAQKAGFSTLSLGPRVLRTETAGLAAIAILQSTFGDLN